MTSSTIEVHVVSQESEIFSGTASFLAAPAEGGEVGIYPKHAPFLTRLLPGTIRVVDANQKEEDFYVSGGFLEVQPTVVTILADTAVRAKDLDEAEAMQAKTRAESALSEQAAKIDYARVRADLAKAIAQLNTIRRLREILK